MDSWTSKSQTRTLVSLDPRADRAVDQRRDPPQQGILSTGNNDGRECSHNSHRRHMLMIDDTNPSLTISVNFFIQMAACVGRVGACIIAEPLMNAVSIHVFTQTNQIDRIIIA